MKTETMIARVMNMEEANQGVLLFHTNEGMLCFHGATKHKTMYRYEAFCKDEHLQDRIFLNPKVNDPKFTPDLVINALKTVCGDMYHEIIAPINGIVVIENEEDFRNLIWSVETYDSSDSKFDGVEYSLDLVRGLPEHNMLGINLATFYRKDSPSLSDALRPALLALTEAGNYILTEEEQARVKALLA